MSDRTTHETPLELRFLAQRLVSEHLGFLSSAWCDEFARKLGAAIHDVVRNHTDRTSNTTLRDALVKIQANAEQALRTSPTCRCEEGSTGDHASYTACTSCQLHDIRRRSIEALANATVKTT
jgi:hypothetical protein